MDLVRGFVALVFLLSPVGRLQASPESLLALPLRPTIAEVKAELSPWPEKNPYPEVQTDAVRQFREKGLARIIASIEKVYPGATWAPLGRDSAMLGDMLDAFYQSIGQHNRVRRLNGSGSTVRYGTLDQLGDFIRDAGYDVLRAEELPPFIAFDTTHYRQTSQLSRIMQAGYRRWVKAGKDPKALVRRFNALNLHTPNLVDLIKANKDLDQFFNDIAFGVTEDPWPQPIFSMDIAGTANVFGYTTEWHDVFGAMEIRDGKTVAAMPKLHGQEQREIVASELYMIIESFRRYPMLEEVKAEARKLGYEYEPEKHCAARIAAQ